MLRKSNRIARAVEILAVGAIALVGCKRKTQPTPAAAGPAISAAATKGSAVATPAKTVVAKSESRGADARPADTAPAPLVVRPGARPDCKDPQPILSEKGLQWFNQRYKPRLAQTWAVVWYVRGPDGELNLKHEGHDVGLPRDIQNVDSNYFAGLLPNRTAGIIEGGPARFVAVTERWHQKLDEFDTVWLGTLSDHCMPVAADDNTLLFSIKLSDRVALQALVERSDKLTDYSKEYYGEGDPVLPKAILKTLSKKDRKVKKAIAVRLRTVKLPWDGTVLHEGPRMDYRESAAWNLDAFDERPESPVVVSVVAPANIGAASLLSRDGRFLAHTSLPCGVHHELAVWTGKDDQGRLTVRFKDRDNVHVICGPEDAERFERIANEENRLVRRPSGGVD